MVTADQNLVKQINKTIVLNAIRRHDTISRIEISQRTGLNKSTVSAFIDELLAEGMLLEVGTGLSSGGRKPVMLTLNKNVCSIIGVDVGVNYLLLILTNFIGEVVWKKRVMLKTGLNKGQRIALLFNLLAEAVARAPETMKGILGIGIGFPGVVNYAKGLILVAPNLGWENVPLGPMVEEKFGIPVFIDNEANAGALGEKWFGLGKRSSDFLYISAGMGIGAGIIIHDKLYRGAYGLAGEIGHMTIESNGEACTCGSKGCWERYASERALLEHYTIQSGKREDETDLEQIIQAARCGDSEAVQSLRYVAKYLGVGIGNLANIFNPQIVIIGNTLGQAEDLIIDEIKRHVWDSCFTANYFAIRIAPSQLNMYACAMGAVSLVIARVYTAPLS